MRSLPWSLAALWPSQSRLRAPNALLLVADLLVGPQVSVMLLRILELAGHLDVFHANAGAYTYRRSGGRGRSGRMGPDADLNINAAFRSVHAVLPYMMEQKTGDIVFTSSVAGVVLVVWEPIYTASKFEDPAGVRPREEQVCARIGGGGAGIARCRDLGSVAAGLFPILEAP